MKPSPQTAFTFAGVPGRRVALAAAAAVVLASGFGYFWARARGTFEKTIEIGVVAPTAHGIHTGELVRLSGVHVGEVESVELGEGARVEVLLAVDQRYLKWLHGDSTVSVDSESLLGDNFVAITPGTAHGGALVDGRTVQFVQNDSMQELRELPRQISQTLHSIDALAATLNDPQADLRTSLHEANALLTELRSTRLKLDSALTSVDRMAGQQIPKTLSNINATLADAHNSLLAADQSLSRLAGSGTQTLQDYRQVAAEMRARLESIQKAIDATQPQLESLIRDSRSMVDDSDAAVQSLRRHWPFSSPPPGATPAVQPDDSGRSDPAGK